MVCEKYSAVGKRQQEGDGVLLMWDANTGEMLRTHAAIRPIVKFSASRHAVWEPGKSRQIEASGEIRPGAVHSDLDC